MQIYHYLQQLYSILAPLSEGFATLWNSVWRDLTARRLILGSLAANVVLLVLALVLASLQPNVTWTTLEMVPSQRLLLLPLLGLLAWLMDACAGAVFYLQEALEKPMVYLLWGMPSFLALLLATAMLIMAF